MEFVRICILFLLIAFFLTGCSPKKEQVETPWGTTLNEDSISEDTGYNLDDIVSNGEMIMLTVSGPETYYDYHGHGMGLHYMLCEKFAQSLGVSLRVEQCRDVKDMIQKLKQGKGDIIAYPLSLQEQKGLLACGMQVDSAKTSWVVAPDNKQLADTLNHWFKPQMIDEMRKEENYLLSVKSIKRHVYSPFLNSSKGIISKYDRYFQTFAPIARMDWKLMAAQCYQESCFDPQARSWAGACGLMQIMPATAEHLGLPKDRIFDPEMNIAGAARYINELLLHFKDVDPSQRIWFAIASYNGGSRHIRDAMALTRKYGRNPNNFVEVAEYILKLQSPAFYHDPVVKYGYMRGSETYDYVNRIRQRWMLYRGGKTDMGFSGGGSGINGMTISPVPSVPQRAKHKYRFHV